MKVLFDQGTPAPLRRHLPGHTVTTAYEAGWSTLANGDLFRAIEAGGFDVFVTTDQNLPHQQKTAGRPFAIVVLTTTSWPKIQTRLAEIAAAVDTALPGMVTVVSI